MLNNVNLSLACAAYRATCKASSTLVACRTNFKAILHQFYHRRRKSQAYCFNQSNGSILSCMMLMTLPMLRYDQCRMAFRSQRLRCCDVTKKKPVLHQLQANCKFCDNQYEALISKYKFQIGCRNKLRSACNLRSVCN